MESVSFIRSTGVVYRNLSDVKLKLKLEGSASSWNPYSLIDEGEIFNQLKPRYYCFIIGFIIMQQLNKEMVPVHASWHNNGKFATGVKF